MKTNKVSPTISRFLPGHRFQTIDLAGVIQREPKNIFLIEEVELRFAGDRAFRVQRPDACALWEEFCAKRGELHRMQAQAVHRAFLARLQVSFGQCVSVNMHSQGQKGMMKMTHQKKKNKHQSSWAGNSRYSTSKGRKTHSNYMGHQSTKKVLVSLAGKKKKKIRLQMKDFSCPAYPRI